MQAGRGEARRAEGGRKGRGAAGRDAPERRAATRAEQAQPGRESFALAARDLGYTASAISQQISALEKET
ncbi:LysR family transcriptional regulator, partial [Streptomyces sioyaensis]|uniref:LysR family transcriptional regulator n=1 Tax=Streptomyces sioyaensis TaxID=67364 RepID=UPI00342DAAEF